MSSPPLQVEVAATDRDQADATSAIRRIVGRSLGPPVTHLMSNGRYVVMLTASGAGYSRWGDIAITRWREDPTSDADGSFIYLRDCESQRVWSATTQPLRDGADKQAEKQELTLAEHHAAYERRDGRLTTTIEGAGLGRGTTPRCVACRSTIAAVRRGPSNSRRISNSS